MINPILTGRLLIILMLPSLLIDSITGWMAMNAPTALSLTQVYRSGMLAAIFFWMACYCVRGFIHLFGVMTILMMFVTWHNISVASLSSLGIDLRFNLSLITHFVYFIFFLGYLSCVKNSIKELNWLKNAIFYIVFFSFLVIAFNIALGIFGIGYSTLASYVQEDDPTSAGGKGFFIAGNDLSSVFLIVAGILLTKLWLKRYVLSYLIFFILLLMLAVALLTKVVILGSLILAICIPFFISGVLSKWRIKYRPLIPLVLGLATGIGLLIWLISSESALIRRAEYIYQNDDLLTAVTTGRSNFFAAAMVAFEKYYDSFDFLFGMGWSGFLNTMNRVFGIEKLVEIDYVDIFMANGIIGLLLVLCIWIWYLCLAINFFYTIPFARSVLFIDILLLSLAGTSGHILFSAMNGMFVALLNFLPILEHSRQSILYKNLVFEK